MRTRRRTLVIHWSNKHKNRGDQFLSTFKGHGRNQPDTNSTIKITAKILEELNPTNESSDTKKRACNIGARLGEFLKT